MDEPLNTWLAREMGIAKALEEGIREDAFLSDSTSILGFPVRFMTPMDMTVLSAAECPYICGGVADHADAAMFLWVLSHDFKNAQKRGKLTLRDRWRKRKLTRAVAGLDIETLSSAIGSYLDQEMMDIPTGGGSSPALAPWHFNVGMYDAIGKRYGVKLEEFLATPLRILGQQLRMIRCSEAGVNPGSGKFTSAVRKEYLRRLNVRHSS